MINQEKKIEIWNSEFVPSAQGFNSPEEYVLYNQMNSNTWESFGKIDTYPDFLLTLYKNSNKHRSIIQTKINLIIGKKKFIFEPKKVEFERLSNGEFKKIENTFSDEKVKEYADQADAFFERIGIRKQLRDIANELCVYGGGYLTITKPLFTDLDGLNSTRKVSRVKFQKFLYARRGKIDILIGDEPTDNFYCVNFGTANKYNTVNFSTYIKQKSKKANSLVKIPTFNEKSNEQFQSLFFGMMDVARDCYPTPDYESKGALASIETDYELSLFDISEAKNGFVNDYIYVIYRGKMEDDDKEAEQRAKEKKHARDQFKGSKNAGGFIINWIDPSGAEDHQLDAMRNPFIEIPHNKKYNYISEKRTSVSREILSAHGVIISELAGLQGYSSNGFSSQSDIMEMASEIWEKQRIGPLRSIIEEQILNRLLSDEGIPMTVKIERDPHIERELTESLLTNNFSEDEIRKMFGHEPRVDKTNVEPIKKD